jgi:hypothetical protein
MTMFHGNQFYAVHSRDVGGEGGRAKTATLKIYLSASANAPACTLARREDIDTFRTLFAEAGDDRAARDRLMSAFVQFAPSA